MKNFPYSNISVVNFHCEVQDRDCDDSSPRMKAEKHSGTTSVQGGETKESELISAACSNPVMLGSESFHNSQADRPEIAISQSNVHAAESSTVGLSLFENLPSEPTSFAAKSLGFNAMSARSFNVNSVVLHLETERLKIVESVKLLKPETLQSESPSVEIKSEFQIPNITVVSPRGGN